MDSKQLEQGRRECVEKIISFIYVRVMNDQKDFPSNEMRLKITKRHVFGPKISSIYVKSRLDICVVFNCVLIYSKPTHRTVTVCCISNTVAAQTPYKARLFVQKINWRQQGRRWSRQYAGCAIVQLCPENAPPSSPLVRAGSMSGPGTCCWMMGLQNTAECPPWGSMHNSGWNAASFVKVGWGLIFL